MARRVQPLPELRSELTATLEAADCAAISHRSYDDQLDLLGQLGLGEQTVVLPEQSRQTGAGAKG